LRTVDRYFMALGGVEFILIAELRDNVTAMAFASKRDRRGLQGHATDYNDQNA
jgi:hypothetical protein